MEVQLSEKIFIVIEKLIGLSHQWEENYQLNKYAEVKNLRGQLESILNDLTLDEIMMIQTIMYMGRDQDYDDTKSSLENYEIKLKELTPAKRKDIEIYQIVSKMPLRVYLANGISIIRNEKL
ncbi:DUF3775 domain-containing protein [Thalassospira sp. MA62]|nr:DUF3775 domain-containing protein [Thalassospira sp. MA62]